MAPSLVITLTSFFTATPRRSMYLVQELVDTYFTGKFLSLFSFDLKTYTEMLLLVNASLIISIMRNSHYNKDNLVLYFTKLPSISYTPYHTQNVCSSQKIVCADRNKDAADQK